MSPDGEWVAFTRRERSDVPPEIRIIPALGGDVRTVIRAASSPAWSRDGTRLVFLRQPERDGPIELTVAGVDGSEARRSCAPMGAILFPPSRVVERRDDDRGRAGDRWYRRRSGSCRSVVASHAAP